MNNKHIKISVICFIIGFLLCTSIIQRAKIIQLETDNKENIETEFILENCPFCDGIAIIQQVNNSFYIECEECELHTNYYGSKKELVKYWNNRN